MKLKKIKIETEYGKVIMFHRKDTTDSYTIKNVISRKKTSGEYFNIEENFEQLNKKSFIWADLGGHVGSFAVRIAKQFGNKVITFEPSKDSFEILVKNLEKNGLKNAVPKNMAVSQFEEKEISFFENNKKGTGQHSILKVRGREETKVKNVEINKVLSEQKIDCIKIDIEGAEYELVKSIKKKNLKKIKIMFLEYHFNRIKDDDKKTKYFEIIKLLKANFKTVIYLKEPKKTWYTHIIAYK